MPARSKSSLALVLIALVLAAGVFALVVTVPGGLPVAWPEWMSLWAPISVAAAVIGAGAAAVVIPVVILVALALLLRHAATSQPAHRGL